MATPAKIGNDFIKRPMFNGSRRRQPVVTPSLLRGRFALKGAAGLLLAVLLPATASAASLFPSAPAAGDPVRVVVPGAEAGDTPPGAFVLTATSPNGVALRLPVVAARREAADGRVVLIAVAPPTPGSWTLSVDGPDAVLKALPTLAVAPDTVRLLAPIEASPCEPLPVRLRGPRLPDDSLRAVRVDNAGNETLVYQDTSLGTDSTLLLPPRLGSGPLVLRYVSGPWGVTLADFRTVLRAETCAVSAGAPGGALSGAPPAARPAAGIPPAADPDAPKRLVTATSVVAPGAMVRAKAIPGGLGYQVVFAPAAAEPPRLRGRPSRATVVTVDGTVQVFAPDTPGEYQLLLYPVSARPAAPVAAVTIHVKGAAAGPSRPSVAPPEPPDEPPVGQAPPAPSKSPGRHSVDRPKGADPMAVAAVRMTAPAEAAAGTWLDVPVLDDPGGLVLALVDPAADGRLISEGPLSMGDGTPLRVPLPMRAGALRLELRANGTPNGVLRASPLTLAYPPAESLAFPAPPPATGCETVNVPLTASAQALATALAVKPLGGRAEHLDVVRLDRLDQERIALFAPPLPGVYELRLLGAVGAVLFSQPLTVVGRGTPEACAAADQAIRDKTMGSGGSE